MNPVLSILLATFALAPATDLVPASAPQSGDTPAAITMRSDSTSDEAFGAPITIDRAAAIDVATIVATPKLYGTTVLVSGSIIDVCTKKGCWLVVTDGKTQMRVTFKDYGFFVPKNSAGREVLLEGIVTREEVSEDDARHYAGESTIGGTKPEEINGPQQVVTMVATGVKFLR